MRHSPATVAAAARAAKLHVEVPHDVDVESDYEDVFGFDDDTPALQEDDGYTSPPTDRSRSSSSLGGWAPRTPSFHAEDAQPAYVAANCKPVVDAVSGLLKVDGGMWDLLKPSSPSPQIITPGNSPFFAQTAI